VDVLGRRSLKAIDEEIRNLVPTAELILSEPIEKDDFQPAEELHLMALAEELPWFRQVLRLEPQQVDGDRVRQVAILLGR
jgi:hypothetical protein